MKGVEVIDLKLVSTLNYNAFQQAEFETKNATMIVELNGYEFFFFFFFFKKKIF